MQSHAGKVCIGWIFIIQNNSVSPPSPEFRVVLTKYNSTQIDLVYLVASRLLDFTCRARTENRDSIKAKSLKNVLNLNHSDAAAEPTVTVYKLHPSMQHQCGCASPGMCC